VLGMQQIDGKKIAQSSQNCLRKAAKNIPRATEYFS
jgi:hypothetical protein